MLKGHPRHTSAYLLLSWYFVWKQRDKSFVSHIGCELDITRSLSAAGCCALYLVGQTDLHSLPAMLMRPSNSSPPCCLPRPPCSQLPPYLRSTQRGGSSPAAISRGRREGWMWKSLCSSPTASLQPACTIYVLGLKHLLSPHATPITVEQEQLLLRLA